MTQHGGIAAQFQGDRAGQRSLTTKFDGMWHLPLIHCPEAWQALSDTMAPDVAFGSPDIVIAVVDIGGIQVTHPDFTGSVSNGKPKVYQVFDFEKMRPNNDLRSGPAMAPAALGSRRLSQTTLWGERDSMKAWRVSRAIAVSWRSGAPPSQAVNSVIQTCTYGSVGSIPRAAPTDSPRASAPARMSSPLASVTARACRSQD